MMKMKIFNPWNERGNSFVEYFVLAMAVLLVTALFVQGGNLTAIQGNVADQFQNMAKQVVP